MHIKTPARPTLRHGKTPPSRPTLATGDKPKNKPTERKSGGCRGCRGRRR